MDFFTVFIFLGAATVWVWLSVLGVVAAKCDQTLEPFQRKAQIMIVIFVPWFGAALVLYLVHRHSPEAIPKTLVPWPIRGLVFAKALSPNKNRDDNEGPAEELSRGHHFDAFGDSSGGSSSGGD